METAKKVISQTYETEMKEKVWGQKNPNTFNLK